MTADCVDKLILCLLYIDVIYGSKLATVVLSFYVLLESFLALFERMCN